MLERSIAPGTEHSWQRIRARIDRPRKNCRHKRIKGSAHHDSETSRQEQSHVDRVRRALLVVAVVGFGIYKMRPRT